MTARASRTGYGSAALATLRTVVAEAKTADPMATVTILVPNNLAGIVARRHLAHGIRDDGRPGVAALHLSTLPRLAEQLAAPSLAPRRPATRPLVSAAWRQALAADPGAFEEVADHPATVRALAQAHTELRHLSPQARDVIREITSITPALLRLHETATAALHDDHYDSTDLLDRATRLVTEHPETIRELGRLVLYLPQDLTQAETRFATALAQHAELAVIAAFTGVRRADGAVATTLQRLGLTTAPAGKDPGPIPTATHVLNASDSDDEVRCVVRDLVDKLKTTPAHRVAILYAATSPYARLLHEHLAQAQVTVNGTGVRAVNERATARVLLETLALADDDVPRADLFRALANAPSRDFDGEPIPISRWERTSRSAGVVHGDDWTTRLDALIETEHAKIATEQDSDDRRDWYIDRCNSTIQTARALQTFTTHLRADLRAAQAMTSWHDLATWCLSLFTTLVGRPDELTTHLPPEEQYAAAAVVSLLNGLPSLDTVDRTASFQALRETLDLELSQALPRVGRFGDGVLVAPVSAAIGLDVDVVYVVGLSEDVYPGRMHEDALLPDRVREASRGEMTAYRERLDTKHRHLLAAFAAAGERTVASFPRGDLRRSSRRLPSRWLLPSLRELCGDTELAASEWDRADYKGKMTTSGSYAGQLLRTDRLAHEQEWRVRKARADNGLDDDVVRAGVDIIDERKSTRFTRFDGNLTGVDALPDYADGDRVISPTALESYANCPHAFFAQRLLGVQQLEQPEDIVVISPADVGNVVHQSLDRLVIEYADTLPGFGEPWSQQQGARLKTIAAEVMAEFEERGLTGHWRLWEREKLRILADLDWLLDDDNQWRADLKARVVTSEMAFGMHGEPPVAVRIADGRVMMRGSADKVDVTEDGTIYVTDVKTGSQRTFKGISQGDPFVDGTKLQLPVYAYAARERLGERATPVHATYWFVRRDRGRIGLDLTLDVEQQYADALRVLTRSVKDGLFPLRAPDQPDFAWVQCDYCNPDGIGHADNRERWERKRHDPVLRELVSLIEPDVLDADADDDVRATADGGPS